MAGGLAAKAGTKSPLSTDETVGEFEGGAALPECPTCGPATGWDHVTGTVEEYRREKLQSQQNIFAALGIEGPRSTRRRRWWQFGG